MEEDEEISDRTNLEVSDILVLLEFVLTTTYFTFRNEVYKQVFGAAMGSPVSPVVAEFFMEELERMAIATAPLDCKPSLWKRYVDDTLEKIKVGSVKQFTEHLSSIDKTNSIKFTYEEEHDGVIPFLDVLIVKKEDGRVKLLVYRKKSHTDQYLHFTSHHPLQHKLGVIYTLFNRCKDVVTEETDRKEEEEKICTALELCGYPKWSFQQVTRE